MTETCPKCYTVGIVRDKKDIGTISISDKDGNVIHVSSKWETTAGHLAFALQENAALRAQLAEAAEVMRQLPKTKDGKYVIPNSSTVWRLHNHPEYNEHGGHNADAQNVFGPDDDCTEWWQSKDGTWYVQDGWSFDVGGLDHMAVKVSECYSSAEACRLAMAEMQKASEGK